ncbi:MAG: hypothetical protein IIZ19_08005 [Clostridia bacterium]|nr:hypothetical protein [Clostridia bacterium]
MNLIVRKLLSLNLAVLAIFLFALPAHAWAGFEPEVRVEDEEEAVPAPEWALSEDEYSIARGEAMLAAGYDEYSPTDADSPDDGDDNAAKLQADGYSIKVGDEEFFSEETCSGLGWSYEDGTLELTGYNGPQITASGDLSVYTSGDVTISGAQGERGATAIAAEGNLFIFVGNGTLNINGGDGTRYGGSAVYAQTFYAVIADGSMTITGGSATNGEWGGHGIDSHSVSIDSVSKADAPFTVKGGSAFMSAIATAGGSGGCGIYAYDIYVNGSGSITGGDGDAPAPAVYFNSSCQFGLINMMLTGGRTPKGRYSTAVQCSGWAEETYYLHPHTTLSGESDALSIEINRYELMLKGGGGLLNGATFTTLYDYYPTWYDLSEYVFSLDGSTQVLWTSASGDLIALDALYRPASDTWLAAEWVEVSGGDTVLNGLGGMFEDGSLWQKYTPPATADPILPSKLTYDDVDEVLAGWGTVLSPEPDDNGVLSGIWYECGTRLKTPEDTYTVLYAENARDGFYIVYHPSSGVPSAGGNVTVQYAYKASSTDLDLYTIDGGSYLKGPNGRAFLGWSTRAMGSADIKPGDTVHVSLGVPINLYAVWDGAEYGYTSDECTAWVDPEKKTVTVEIDETTYKSLGEPSSVIVSSYERGSRFKGCAVGAPQKGGTTELTVSYDGEVPPMIRVFSLDSSFRPKRNSIDINIPAMTPSSVR